MYRTKTFSLALASILAVGGAVALGAQTSDEREPMGGMMGMMQSCPMMSAMAEDPEAVLRHAEELDLTPDQVTRLEGIKAEAGRSRMAAMAEMRELHQRIEAITDADAFPEAEAASAFGAMGELHARMALTMARTRHAAREVLTPEQRESLAELSGAHSTMMGSDRGRMGGMMGMMRMMQRCPMMQGADAAQPDSMGGPR